MRKYFKFEFQIQPLRLPRSLTTQVTKSQRMTRKIPSKSHNTQVSDFLNWLKLFLPFFQFDKGWLSDG